MLAFDLDRFKAINDRHGHQKGDQVLQVFAETARAVLGPDAILARIGGEEFAALLAGDAAGRAQTLGESIAQRFAAAIAAQADGIAMPATVSIGLARYERAAPPLAETLAAADRALYSAKEAGGNRLVAAWQA